MAGSRAPKGSLRSIADSVPKAGSRKTGLFGPTKSQTPKVKANTFTGDDSGSDTSSSSDSDSDSGSDSDTKNEPIAELQKRIAQTPASKTKSDSAKSKSDSKFTTPAKSPTVNGLTTSVKKGSSEQKIKKEDTSSESSEDESDKEESNSSSDEEGDKQSQKDKRATTTKSSSDSSSDESSASESESESSKAKTSQETVPKGKATVEKEDSTSTSSSESDSDSEESESESEDDDNSEDAAQQIEEQIRNEVTSAESSASKTKNSHAPISEDGDSDTEMMDQSIALTNGGSPTKVGSVPEFIAPDFHLRKLEGTPNASEITTFFSKAQLEGKQVWYITAPASLPVTVIEDLTIPMDEAEKGMPVLTHMGEDYRMAFDNPAASSSYRLLVPNKKGDEYSLLNRTVNQSMHFTRSETFPPDGPASVTMTQTIATTKPARPQPEGLRARYTPLGVSSPKPTITAPPSTKKAATSVVAGNTTPEISSKKKRKHRDDGEDGPIANAITPNRKETPSGKKNSTAEKSAKKQKTSNEPDQTSAPRRQTPVPLPTQVNGAYRSGSKPPSTQAAPRSRSSASPGAALPATQVPAKQTPIPLPPLVRSTSSVQLGSTTPMAGENQREQSVKKAKKAKKEKKIKAEEGEDSPVTTSRKVSQILPPRYDQSGLRIS